MSIAGDCTHNSDTEGCGLSYNLWRDIQCAVG